MRMCFALLAACFVLLVSWLEVVDIHALLWLSVVLLGVAVVQYTPSPVR